MALLDDETTTEVRQKLKDLAGPVNLVLFTDPDPEGARPPVAELLREVAGLSDKITLEEHDRKTDASLAFRYGIERVPAIVVEGERDYGIRYYGFPGGFEFGTLIEVMADVARGKAELRTEISAGLATLAGPVHIQVFVTPT